MSILLQVKMNGPKHSCGSVNKCGDTMASSAWVAARAVDFLKEKPYMCPKELQQQLKKSTTLRCHMVGFLEAKRRLLTSSIGSGMIVMKLCQHIKLSFSNQCLAVLLSMTQKRIKEIYASKDSLLLLNHALMVSCKVVYLT
jgi:hypothetical protein